MNSDSIAWLGATSPPWFKAMFLIGVAVVIPGFFVVMWLMSRSHRNKRKPESDKKNV
jgi:hypothetical protein